MNIPRILAFALPVLAIIAAIVALGFWDVPVEQKTVSKTIPHDRMAYARDAG